MAINHSTVTGNCVRYHGCTRPECIERRRRYGMRTAKLSKMGKKTTTPAGPVARKVRADLEASGFSQTQMARSYGISLNTVSSLAKCPPSRRVVQRRVADKIAAWRYEPGAHPRGQVPAIGTTRRIRSLIRDGHSSQELTQRMVAMGAPSSRAWIWGMAAGDATITSGTRADAVTRIFDQLLLRPGTNAASRGQGRRAGWCRPMVWEPEDIDNPDVPEPADEEVRRCVACHRPMFTRKQIDGGLEHLTAHERRRVVSQGGPVPHRGSEHCRRCHGDLG